MSTRTSVRRQDLLYKAHKAGRNQRTPWFVMGDSGMAKDGHGDFDGYSLGLAMTYRHFGTGVVPARQGVTGHLQVGAGQGIALGTASDPWRNGAPAELEAFCSAHLGGKIISISSSGGKITFGIDRLHQMTNGSCVFADTGDATNIDGTRTITVESPTSISISGSTSVTTPAGSVLQNELRGGWRFPYMYMPAGKTLASAASPGILDLTFRGNPGASGINSSYIRGFMDLNAALTWFLTYGTFPTGSGNFRAQIRNADSPYTTLALSSVINTNQGAYGLNTAQVSLAAATRNVNLSCRLAQPGGLDMTGPVFVPWSQAVQDDRLAGVSLTCGMAWGGAGAWDWASLWKSAYAPLTIRHLAEIFKEMQRPVIAVGQTPIAVVAIESAFNDRNETQPSWLAGLTPGNSKAATKDNFKALIQILKAAWKLAGYADDQLIVILSAAHRVNWTYPVDDANIEDYCDAQWELAGEMEGVAYLGTNRDAVLVIPDGDALGDGGEVLDHMVEVGYQRKRVAWCVALATIGEMGPVATSSAGWLRPTSPLPR